MADTYTLHVAGLTRELTICKVNDHMDIAAFIMLGDAELTVAAATELLKKCPEFDILLTAEAKGIPLAHWKDPPHRFLSHRILLRNRPGFLLRQKDLLPVLTDSL